MTTDSNVSLLQENLAKGLAIVGRASSTRSTLPVLANTLIRAKDGRLMLCATNLEIIIQAYIGAKIASEFAITLPTRTLADLVNSLPQERVDIRYDKQTQQAHLACGRVEANIKGIDADEFPMIPEVPTGGMFIKTETLKKLISQVTFAAATDDARPVLTGVSVVIKGKKITMATTDGFRLSVADGELETSPESDLAFVVPAKALTEVARVVSPTLEEVHIKFIEGRQQIIFDMESVVLISQLVDGNFPDYRPVVPSRYTTRTTIGLAELTRAVKMAHIFARESSNTMSLSVVPGNEITPAHVLVKASSTETGDNEAKLDATAEGGDIAINLNATFFAQALGAIDTPQVAIETTIPTEPAVIKPVGQNGFVHIIMPMQFGR